MNLATKQLRDENKAHLEILEQAVLRLFDIVAGDIADGVRQAGSRKDQDSFVPLESYRPQYQDMLDLKDIFRYEVALCEDPQWRAEQSRPMVRKLIARWGQSVMLDMPEMYEYEAFDVQSDLGKALDRAANSIAAYLGQAKNPGENGYWNSLRRICEGREEEGDTAKISFSLKSERAKDVLFQLRHNDQADPAMGTERQSPWAQASAAE